MSATEKTPLIIVGDYTPIIPFNFSLYVAETDLVSSDTLTPLVGPGLPENLKPKIGARVIYRLISDGTHAPILGAGFKKKSSAMGYDYTPGAVNILEFVYDGFDFWYSMASDSSGSAPDFIGDFGLTPAELSVRIAPTVSAMGVNELASASAYDFITAIHYVGIEPLTYRLRKANPPGQPWVEDTNPRLCRLSFACAELGQQWIEIEVTNGTLTSNVVDTSCTIQDNGNYC